MNAFNRREHGGHVPRSKVVIIVPAYQCEAYVAETLESLMAQGDALKEVDRVILADDASTDRTIEVARTVWRGPVPIEIRPSARNQGEYLNMNDCIASLEDDVEWYLVMHADNLAKAGWLRTLLDRLRVAGASVGSISTSWDDFDESGVRRTGENEPSATPRLIAGGRESVAGTLKQGCWWHISSCATRVRTYREVGGLPQGFRLKGDWDFLLRVLGAGWDVEYIPKSLMLYRMNPAGSSSVTFRRHRDVVETLDVFRMHRGALSPREVLAYHIRQLGVLGRRIGVSLLRGQFARAFAGFEVGMFVIRSWWRCRFENQGASDAVGARTRS